MKGCKYILLFTLVLVTTVLRAQDMSNVSDSIFFEYAKSLKNRGNEYYALSNRIGIKQVIDEYQNALAKRKAAGNLTDEMEGYFMQDIVKLNGDYHYENSDFDKTSYAEAEKYFKKYRDYCLSHLGTYVAGQGLYVIHQELAQLYYKQGRYQEACDEMKVVVATAKSYMKDEDEPFDKLSQYAICQARVNQFDEAISNIDEVLDNYENTDSERYGEALRKKAKILMLSEEQGGQVSRSEALECYRRFFMLKKTDALAHFMRMNTEEREMYWMKIRPFVTDCYRLEDADAGFLYDVTLFAKGLLLQLDSTGGGKQNIHTTWKMIQNKLKPNACAIEFIQYEKYGQQQMGALVLKSTGNPVFLKMATPDSVMQYETQYYFTVSDALKSFRNNRLSGESDRINGLYNDSTGLFNYIWNTEIIKAIGDSHDVWFAPDGYVHQLAIEYMLPERLLHISCHRLTSTKLLLDQKETPSYEKAMIVGGIDYNTSDAIIAYGNDAAAFRYVYNNGKPTTFTILGNSLNEAKEICKLRNNARDTLLVGALAMEQSFRQICSDYSIIHISSHGMFSAASTPQGTDLKQNLSDNSLSHSLVAFSGINYTLKKDGFDENLQDGILSAREMASLDMSKVELIVLCCCETGLGFVTPDGVYGIQRGLKNAGVRAIICTLWDIDDEASSFFMLRFHQYLKEEKDLYRAFYQARKAMNEIYNEPCYRDAFILIDAI